MSEMIERVARAIAESKSARDWARMSEHGKDWWRDEARAAIEAMRKPTRAMIEAAATVDRYAEPGEEWGPMINAALSRCP